MVSLGVCAGGGLVVPCRVRFYGITHSDLHDHVLPCSTSFLLPLRLKPKVAMLVPSPSSQVLQEEIGQRTEQASFCHVLAHGQHGLWNGARAVCVFCPVAESSRCFWLFYLAYDGYSDVFGRCRAASPRSL